MRRMLCSIRNLCYIATISLLLYGLFFIAATKEPTDYLPDYLKPKVHQRPSIWPRRADSVKAAFVHAYHGYEKYAAPHDELRPITKVGSNHYNGWGVTAFDALDTMLLMDLKDEYTRAVRIVEMADFNQTTKDFIPYFETVIRYLGGLLSAYAISPNQSLLTRAEELAAILDPVFDTPSGMPQYGVYTTKKPYHDRSKIAILAEAASLQLEYTYLAKLTGKAQYLNRSETIMNHFKNANLSSTGGMLPVQWDLMTGKPLDHRLTVGAQADSSHEYLLKLFLLTGKTDERSLILYLRATTQIITQLLYLSPQRGLLYVTDTSTSTYNDPGVPSHLFEHLSCFLPGLLALGAHTLPLDRLVSLGINLAHLGNETLYGHAGKAYHRLSKYDLKELHLWAAEGLAQTCYLTYADSATGLGPDEIAMNGYYGAPQVKGGSGKGTKEPKLWIDALDSWTRSSRKGLVPGLENKKPIVYTEKQRLRGRGRGRDYVMRKTDYLLRPETVESLYILWKTTGNVKWRQWGWAIFQAIDKHTKTETGYAYIKHVDRLPPSLGDAMPSFFLAETLKYLYLMFLDEDPISLDKWVFNTEAHPFPVFQWTPEEKSTHSLLYEI